MGDFKNAGREWQLSGAPEPVRAHDVPGDATGKAIPSGVYDMARNEAWVSVGRDHKPVKDYGGYKDFVRNGINVSDIGDDFRPVPHARTKHRTANELPLAPPW